MLNLSLYYITLENKRCFVLFKIPTHPKLNVIYATKCPGCGEDYDGRTERCVITRLNEHINRSDHPMFQHLQHCKTLLEAMTLYQLPDIDTDVRTVNLQSRIASAVSDNWKILGSNTNWIQLSFLESLFLKRLKPKANDGLKASKELLLFP